MADDISIGTKNTTEQHEALQKCFTRLLVKGTFVKWHKTKSPTVFLEKYYKYLKAVLDSPSTLPCATHQRSLRGHAQVSVCSCVALSKPLLTAEYWFQIVLCNIYSNWFIYMCSRARGRISSNRSKHRQLWKKRTCRQTRYCNNVWRWWLGRKENAIQWDPKPWHQNYIFTMLWMVQFKNLQVKVFDCKCKHKRYASGRQNHLFLGEI